MFNKTLDEGQAETTLGVVEGYRIARGPGVWAGVGEAWEYHTAQEAWS